MGNSQENNKVQNCVPASSRYGDEYVEESLREFARILYDFLIVEKKNA